MFRRSVLLSLSLCLVMTSRLHAGEHYLKPGPVHLDNDGKKWAEKTLKKLSVEEKIGQLFMVWSYAEFLNVASPEFVRLREEIQKYHLGSLALTVREEGPFLYRNQPLEAAMVTNELQRESKLPLIFAADFERGLSMRLHGTTVFPHAMAFGATGYPEYAAVFGRITALESRAIGVHWNFFPDADVNSNPANPIINTRSFGEDPQAVSKLVAEYIVAARVNGMMTTAKHFPGHGDTGTDSHLGVAQVNASLDELRQVDLPPFEKAIEAGVDAIMVAHVSLPALDANPNHVATTSPAVIQGLLEQQLGFKGIVVTDALDMGALTRLYAPHVGRAAVDAFKAGNDLLIIPADLDGSYNAMLAAVRSGEISQERLDESVLKILEAKAAVGLNKARLVDVTQLPNIIGKPENVALGQQIADAAITLVRDNGRVLPLKATGTKSPGLPYLEEEEETRNRVVAVVFSDDMRLEAGRTFELELRKRVPDANVMYVDPRTAAPMSNQVLAAVQQAQKVIAAVYIVPHSGKKVNVNGVMQNTVGLVDAPGALLQQILERAGDKTIVAAMGSPYLASDFPQVQNYLCAYSNVSVSDTALVKALFGEIAIRGHLPVTIPNIAARGAGLERPATGGSHVGSTQ
jgi:beta-N-acetylhexosaminidase